MRTIKRILESLLDVDFDIDVDDIGSLHDMNYQCEKFKGNKTFWWEVYNDNIRKEQILRANSGFRRLKFAQQNVVDFDEIVDANTSAPFEYLLDTMFWILNQAGVGEDSFKVGFDRMIKSTHQKYTYKFKYYRNNILFSAEWANGAKVSMKFVPQ